MNLNIQIPDNTALIFEYMQKGQFICSNSTDIDLRDMYNMIDENYESLYQYFSQINYTLERGNEYFYFSRTESKTTLEQKILRAYYWNRCNLISSKLTMKHSVQASAPAGTNFGRGQYQCLLQN